MYGFIQKDSDGKDVFVHFSAIAMEGYKSLKTNDSVEFDITDGDKGPQAANVIITGTSPGEVSETPKKEEVEVETESK